MTFRGLIKNLLNELNSIRIAVEKPRVYKDYRVWGPVIFTILIGSFGIYYNSLQEKRAQKDRLYKICMKLAEWRDSKHKVDLERQVALLEACYIEAKISDEVTPAQYLLLGKEMFHNGDYARSEEYL